METQLRERNRKQNLVPGKSGRISARQYYIGRRAGTLEQFTLSRFRFTVLKTKVLLKH